MVHELFLVRHGEQVDAEHGVTDGQLSEKGRKQAQLVAERLQNIQFDAAWHSPLERATETARIMAQHHTGIKPESSLLLFDCIPSGPAPETPAAFAPFFGAVTEEDIEAGKAQMLDATSEFLSSRRMSRRELLITHNFVIGWFVREVLEAPMWRWVSINQANCGLTVLAQKPGRPWSLITHNDVAHLPPELRTGLPEPYLV